MSFDTTAENKKRQHLDSFEEIWVFGYGSLIYKVDFPYLKKSPAKIQGWSRRFWQGSHDHRGTPENPGRVLTLVESSGEECAGMAYQVSQEVFEHLDHREKNGYLRFEIEIQKLRSNHMDADKVIGLVYIAKKNNAAYLGPLPEKEIAQHINMSAGPSGHNRDYVFCLANALRLLQVEDLHVFKVETHLKLLMQS